MSASEAMAGGAYLKVGLRYNQVITGLGEIKKQVGKVAGDASKIGQAGGAFRALGPAVASVAGPLQGVVSSMGSLLTLNPISWAAGAAAAIGAYVAHIISLDEANHRALESGERLTRLYGEEVARLGFQGRAIDLDVQARTLQMIDQYGAAETSRRQKEQLAELRREYKELEKQAVEFGLTIDEVTQKLAKGTYTRGAMGHIKDTITRDITRLREAQRKTEDAADAAQPGSARKILNAIITPPKSLDDHVADVMKEMGRPQKPPLDIFEIQGKIQGVAETISALERAEREWLTEENQLRAGNFKERKKQAEELAVSLNASLKAADAANAAYARVVEDKAAEDRIQADPTAAVREWLQAETEARDKENKATESLRALRAEILGLQAKQNNLTAEEGRRLADLKSRVENIAAARARAADDAARALRMGEKAAQAAQKEAEEITRAAKERAKLNERVQDIVAEIQAMGYDDNERRRFELQSKQARQLADVAQADEYALRDLRIAHARERAQLERKFSEEAAEREKKGAAEKEEQAKKKADMERRNADALLAHQLAFLPEEYRARARMLQQFEDERKLMLEAGLGPDSPEVKRLEAWQAARLQLENFQIAEPSHRLAGGWGSRNLGRTVAQGVSQKDGESRKMLQLTEDMRQALMDIRRELAGGVDALG